VSLQKCVNASNQILNLVHDLMIPTLSSINYLFNWNTLHHLIIMFLYIHLQNPTLKVKIQKHAQYDSYILGFKGDKIHKLNLLFKIMVWFMFWNVKGVPIVEPNDKLIIYKLDKLFKHDAKMKAKVTTKGVQASNFCFSIKPNMLEMKLFYNKRVCIKWHKGIQ
jgi:hypothetical protein